MTAQRQMILDAVCEAEGHATPEEVCELVQARWPAVNRATVYRTLKFLAEMDVLAATTGLDGQSEYEIIGSRPHHHIVCTECGADEEFDQRLLQPVAEQLLRLSGFRLDSNHFTFSGVCPACQKEE